MNREKLIEVIISYRDFAKVALPDDMIIDLLSTVYGVDKFNNSSVKDIVTWISSFYS